MNKSTSRQSHVNIGYDLAREYLSYDSDSGVVVWIKSPCIRKKVGSIAGSIYTGATGKKYNKIKLKGKRMFAHNLIWLLETGGLPVGIIDHIDGNGLNNKMCNLRVVTAKENCRNTGLSRLSKSGITGVTWSNRRHLWRSRIRVDGVEIHLAETNDFFEACCLRKSAQNKYKFHPNHGSPRLNEE